MSYETTFNMNGTSWLPPPPPPVGTWSVWVAAVLVFLAVGFLGGSRGLSKEATMKAEKKARKEAKKRRRAARKAEKGGEERLERLRAWRELRFASPREAARDWATGQGPGTCATGVPPAHQ
ncbi:hypothetical protein PG990_000077 [Apiospora arundinis]